MQFSKIALPALFAALASTCPMSPHDDTEAITITKFDVRNVNSAVASSSLSISSESESAVITCDSTQGCSVDGWSYQVVAESLDTYQLSVYKQTGQSSGIWDSGNFSIICHAGGSAATDYACNQPPQISISLNLHV